MDRIALKILNNELTFIGDIEDYISFYFVRSFFQAKEFQLIAPIKYASILKEDNYIYLSKKKSMIIEDIEIDELKEQITVKGRDIKSIIETRITEPPLNEAYDIFNGSAEEVIKHYVDRNCINPVDTSRKIKGLVLGPNLERGANIKWQSRYKNLLVEAEAIGKSGGIGWFIYIDHKAKQLIFDVETGKDRTASQNINSRVIFSSDFNNIANTIHKSSSINYRNVGYVGGQGEGSEREIQIVTKGNYEGSKRREVFIDARDVSESSGLQDRGLAKLSQYDYILNTESTITNKNLLYERDWNLGDIATVKNNFGTNDLRITEVREIYEGNLIVEITVGNVEGTVLDKINNNISNIPNEGVSASGDKSYTFNQISPKGVWKIPHGLGKYPSVTVVDSGGNKVVGDIKYIDINNLEISFVGGFSGIAYLN
ncbi:siphovirus ReqiPepy6 Gp37-like family protein [Clostridium culturomicium]|uniref:siphovirus ReqiPepy6 Gp37-like family protein n=1 Tax=Clostridium culturomicium TaxID=1499683 RepID=UPI0038579C0D